MIRRKAILDKPSRLTAEEYEIMKMHTVYGERCLKSVPGKLGKLAREIALLHHEKWDGTGYWGYKASCLPRHISIVSVCDVYCALISSERPYKKPWAADEALRFIENQAEKQFCPKVVNAFLTLFEDKKSEILAAY